MNRFSSKALILRKRDYAEADKIVVVYTQKYGKVSFIAKGVKKIKSKKRGSIEIGNIVLISTTKIDRLGILTEAVLIKSFGEIRNSLNKITLLHYFAEVVDRLTQPQEPDPALFDFLVKYFLKLEKTNQLKKMRKEFIGEILILLGFWPQDKAMPNPDEALEEILERSVNSARVGKRLVS